MKKILIASFYATILLSAGLKADPKYEFISLNDLINDQNSSRAFIMDINDNGSILYSIEEGKPLLSSNILNGNIQIKLPDTFDAIAINNSEHVAGMVDVGNTFPTPGYWNGKNVSQLGTLGGDKISVADINNLNQIIGLSATVRTGELIEEHATLWDHGKVIDLGVINGGFASSAIAINDKSQIIGISETKTISHPFIWQNGVLSDLYPALDSAFDINNEGQVLGSSAGHIVLWQNGSTKYLFDLLIPLSNMELNDLGVIIGTSNGLEQTPFIFDNGNLYNLNSLLDPIFLDQGWRLISATHINNHGVITGLATNILTAEHISYILKPVSEVPEPTTWAMLLAGLGLIGFMGRRNETLK